jgi:hypothetical protein
MSGDPGDNNEFADPIDRHREDDPTMTEDTEISVDEVTADRPITPYAGSEGGAVGGTPAEGRSSGGNIQGGLAPGAGHRGDSTIGADPGAGSGSARSSRTKSRHRSTG